MKKFLKKQHLLKVASTNTNVTPSNPISSTSTASTFAVLTGISASSNTVSTEIISEVKQEIKVCQVNYTMVQIGTEALQKQNFPFPTDEEKKKTLSEKWFTRTLHNGKKLLRI
ncbi:uncharacterized protein LOC136086479 [Hydra vulgaris]|uniref:Uncharacterized protein LOC136086479 n=1 Tax=Hydra vulgaris TaxID=6087 RepID=A0ABM4CSH2_HYDVU